MLRQSVSGALTYSLPAWPRGSVWRTLTERWSVDAVFRARSALPVNVVTGTAPFAVSNALRPDVRLECPGLRRRFNRSWRYAIQPGRVCASAA
jgi:hypothetical protein